MRTAIEKIKHILVSLHFMKQQVFDRTRKKFVALTPEEEVRQAVIKWLTESAGIPAGVISCEHILKINGRNFRADIVVFGKNLNPVLLVECKAPHIKLDNSVIEQILLYNSRLKVRYLMITNGTKTFLFSYDEMANQYTLAAQMPSYQELKDISPVNTL